MLYIEDDQIVAVANLGILDRPADTTSLKSLHNAIPEVKVLLIVKNPIDRVVSDIIHEFSAVRQR